MSYSKSTVLLCLLTLTLLYGCSNAYKLQKTAPFQYTRAYFQYWTAPIKIGSSGINLHIANLTPNNNVVIDSVFFRNMKGRLVPGKGKYFCQLIKRKPIAEGHTLMTLSDFPFDISNRDCVVSYRVEGETKYVKVANLIENEGVYYESGVPDKL
ncbi:hypothetical protein ACU8DI_03510 [Psychroserpens sp. BH13MA-6]